MIIADKPQTVKRLSWLDESESVVSEAKFCHPYRNFSTIHPSIYLCTGESIGKDWNCQQLRQLSNSAPFHSVPIEMDHGNESQASCTSTQWFSRQVLFPFVLNLKSQWTLDSVWWVQKSFNVTAMMELDLRKPTSTSEPITSAEPNSHEHKFRAERSLAFSITNLLNHEAQQRHLLHHAVALAPKVHDKHDDSDIGSDEEHDDEEDASSEIKVEDESSEPEEDSEDAKKEKMDLTHPHSNHHNPFDAKPGGLDMAAVTSQSLLFQDFSKSLLGSMAGSLPGTESDVIKVPAHRPNGGGSGLGHHHPLVGHPMVGPGISPSDYASLLYRPMPFPGYLPTLHSNLLAARFGGKLKIMMSLWWFLFLSWNFLTKLKAHLYYLRK